MTDMPTLRHVRMDTAMPPFDRRLFMMLLAAMLPAHGALAQDRPRPARGRPRGVAPPPERATGIFAAPHASSSRGGIAPRHPSQIPERATGIFAPRAQTGPGAVTSAARPMPPPKEAGGGTPED